MKRTVWISFIGAGIVLGGAILALAGINPLIAVAIAAFGNGLLVGRLIEIWGGSPKRSRKPRYKIIHYPGEQVDIYIYW